MKTTLYLKNAPRTISLFILGAILGASVMTIVSGKHLNRLSIDLKTLRMQYDEVWHENQQLTALLHKPQAIPVLHSIKVEATAPDAIVEIEGSQVIKQKLSYLVGYAIAKLDGTTIYKLVEGETFSVDQQQYQIHVKTIVIGETLHIYVRISPQSPK